MVAGRFRFPTEDEPRNCKLKATSVEGVEGWEEESQRWEGILKQANQDSLKAVLIMGTSGPVGYIGGTLLTIALGR
jgi:hypothetical protein